MALTDFLLARIAEDVAAAEEIPAGSWEDACSTTRRYDHVFRWSPARALAECEAKRQIVEMHTPFGKASPSCEVCADDGPYYDHGCVDWPCPTLRAVAAVYADHPDYQQEWKP